MTKEKMFYVLFEEICNSSLCLYNCCCLEGMMNTSKDLGFNIFQSLVPYTVNHCQNMIMIIDWWVFKVSWFTNLKNVGQMPSFFLKVFKGVCTPK
jgi:hypothetical protein